ncbi:fetal and adult testis-expressed transcript protein homolog isoform X2 [Varanus komodoensis]|uniref:fetal and adult testis-expressed transcript protein homolog isoform X2 n=1 Tax=Varanus komodoensis TaxID=61221 RepID=UPI001CF7BC66|nr:fetal and adult testis-expressed transcript protein homolog isoform X2 [Varanus komodoensis]
MWPAGRPLLEEAPCSADFTEAIDRGMRVPQRLRAAEDSGAGGPAERMLEDFCPSLQMHVPDRLLLAEMPDAALRPLLGNQLRQPWPDVSEPPLEPAAQTAVYGAHPFLSFVPCSGSHRSNQLPELRVGAQKEGVLLESTQLATGRVRQRQGCAWEASPALGSSLEDLGAAEILVMRKQLTRISGRLQVLEEQRVAWHQKELLLYSALLSTCLLSTWLWLRR